MAEAVAVVAVAVEAVVDAVEPIRRTDPDRHRHPWKDRPRKDPAVHDLDDTMIRSLARRSLLAALALLLPLGCQPAADPAPKSFATPEAATEALFDALERNDQEAVLTIFGSEHADSLVTPDWDANLESRLTIAREGRAQHELETLEDGTLQLLVGSKEWPFPMLIVPDDDAWRFDTAGGIQELVDRRIGENELTAIEILDAYVDAQIEYATEDRDGDGMLEYARKLASTPGEQDGLYWESADGAPQSPFGPLVVRAESFLATRKPDDPIRGYYFEILSGQGSNAPGGDRGYTIDGEMRTGFALVAYPADYGNTGIMTFIVSHRGKIHQQDLGAFTGMDAYDPDDGWSLVDE